MKEEYVSAEMEVIEFESEDVITASGLDYNPENDETPMAGK